MRAMVWWSVSDISYLCIPLFYILHFWFTWWSSQTEVDIMCKLSSLCFFFCLSLAACSLLMSCSWYLTLTILSVKGSPPAGLPDEKKGKFAWFSHSTESHGNVPLHSVSTLCVSVCLCAGWPITQLCILLHACAWLCLLLVQCPPHALRIRSYSANQSLANVFKIVFHLQISSNMSWKCFTSSSKMTCEISAFWLYSCRAYSGQKISIMNVGFFSQLTWLFHVYQNMNSVYSLICLSK